MRLFKRLASVKGFTLAATLLAALVTSPANAADVLAAVNNPLLSTVQYSADVVYKSQQMQSSGKLYHAAPGLERREMDMMGQDSIVIINKQEIFMLMPAMNVAMRMTATEDPITYALKKSETSGVTYSKIGSETINGEKTDKYRLGGDAQGMFWVTPDGILVRANIPSNGDMMHYDISKIKRGSQPKSLFEVPPGMKIIDNKDMSNMIRVMQQAQ